MIPELTFYAVVVKLCAKTEGWMPTTQGRLAHGAFLDLVRGVDPQLSAALHTPQQRRPFTVSPLQGVGRPRNGQVRVRVGEAVWLRFTLLNSQLFGTLARFLLNSSLQRGGGLPVLRLGEVDFAITEMLTTPGSHPWAGYTSANQLCQKWQGGALEPAHYKIGFQLASGMVFSRSSNKDGMGKFMEALPVPEMVFGSLAAAWNEHTGLNLDKGAIRDYARETVVVSAYKLETQLFHYWGQPQIGAVGWVTYQLKDRQYPELSQALNLLADFAFYNGLGAKTTMGMGMVKQMKPEG